LTAAAEISESKLIALCLADDRHGQEMLFNQYKKAMFSKVLRILNDYDEANDALQEGFIEVFKNLASFKADATLGAWIKTIMVRQAIRRQKNMDMLVSLDIEQHDLTYEVSDTFTAQMLDVAIKSLPDGCRTVFLLIEVEGYAHKEVAAMLNVSEGSTKSQLNYAKKLLRKKLANV
jgi:RNA polymerase sigma factor (sigma-70 family)